MNAFMDPTAPSHHAQLATYGLKMSPPPSLHENVGTGMLSSNMMNASGGDHNAVGISNNTNYQATSYGPCAAATAPYPTYSSRDYLLKREQDYFSMAGQTANVAATPPDPVLFPSVHHAHAMHDNQFTSYHQHQMRMGIGSGAVGSSVSGQITAASGPQSVPSSMASSSGSVTGPPEYNPYHPHQPNFATVMHPHNFMPMNSSAGSGAFLRYMRQQPTIKQEMQCQWVDPETTTISHHHHHHHPHHPHFHGMGNHNNNNNNNNSNNNNNGGSGSGRKCGKIFNTMHEIVTHLTVEHVGGKKFCA